MCFAEQPADSLPEWTRDVGLVARCEFAAAIGTLTLVAFLGAPVVGGTG